MTTRTLAVVSAGLGADSSVDGGLAARIDRARRRAARFAVTLPAAAAARHPSRGQTLLSSGGTTSGSANGAEPASAVGLTSQVTPRVHAVIDSDP